MSFDETRVFPRWLRILREHGYNPDRIANPADDRDNVIQNLRTSRIEPLRGDRGTYSTTAMQARGQR